MNETLKFSWGHIVSFLALIYMSYVSFMGAFYMTNGDLLISILAIIVIDVVLLAVFSWAQLLKATEKKFDKRIRLERFVVFFLCPIVVIAAMLPQNYFWLVYGERDLVVSSFNSSIVESKGMFDDYEKYAQQRIDNYTSLLDRTIGKNPTGKDKITKENYINTLRLQLLSVNYDSLCSKAIRWIDNAGRDGTVWNAFLVGNSTQITQSIEKWHGTLVDFSTPTLSNEIDKGNTVTPFDVDGASLNAATTGLQTIVEVYAGQSGVSWITFPMGILLFICLLLPYIVQQRNTKARRHFSLLPMMHKEKPQVTSGDGDIYSGTIDINNDEPARNTSSGNNIYNSTIDLSGSGSSTKKPANKKGNDDIYNSTF